MEHLRYQVYYSHGKMGYQVYYSHGKMGYQVYYSHGKKMAFCVVPAFLVPLPTHDEPYPEP
jgi:hypothetical protein